MTDGERASAGADDIVATLVAREESVAVAESLTGGLVTAALTAVPGASAVVRGGVVAYLEQVKAGLLAVDADLLARNGAVDPAVAAQMALGVRRLLGSTYGVATTGSAGPDPAPGGVRVGPVPPGRGFVAVSGPHGEVVVGFDRPDADRAGVRALAVEAALSALRRALLDGPGPDTDGPDDGRASGLRGSVEP